MKVSLEGESPLPFSDFEIQQWVRLDEVIRLGIEAGSLGCLKELDVDVVIGRGWLNAHQVVAGLRALFDPSSESCARTGMVRDGKVPYRWKVALGEAMEWL